MQIMLLWDHIEKMDETRMAKGVYSAELEEVDLDVNTKSVTYSRKIAPRVLATGGVYEKIDESGRGKRSVFGLQKMDFCGICQPIPRWDIGVTCMFVLMTTLIIDIHTLRSYYKKRSK